MQSMARSAGPCRERSWILLPPESELEHFLTGYPWMTVSLKGITHNAGTEMAQQPGACASPASRCYHRVSESSPETAVCCETPCVVLTRSRDSGVPTCAAFAKMT